MIDPDLERDLSRHPLLAVLQALTAADDGHDLELVHVRALILASIDQADTLAHDPHVTTAHAAAGASLARRYRHLATALDHIATGDLEHARACIRSAINPQENP